jgi:rubrerythrin
LSGFDRDNLAKLIKKCKKNIKVFEVLSELKRKFEDKLEKYDEHMYERAWENFNDMVNDFNKTNDQEVADFFGISPEIDSYELDNGDTILAKDVIGECKSCGSPFTKKELFVFNDDLLQKCKDDGWIFEENKTIGRCLYCEEELVPREVSDKDVGIVVNL